MGSSRLPGKVLKEVCGRPLLDILVERVRRARRLDTVVIATSVERQDDAIADRGGPLGVAVFRGSEDDTMDRFLEAARWCGLDVAVRVTGDAPLIDPATIDAVVDTLVRGGFDYVSTDLVPQYPNGMGCDACTRTALERLHAASRGRDPDESWMLTRDPAIGLRCGLAPASRWGDLSRYRLTVDTPEDLDVVSRVAAELMPAKAAFDLDDIVTVLRQHEDWTHINAHVVQKTGPHRRST